MRRRNWRLVITGALLIALAAGFFVFMMGLMPKSNDPAAMMHTVGQVCGVGIGIAIVLIVIGLVGKKT
jgi:hypothetical protein